MKKLLRIYVRKKEHLTMLLKCATYYAHPKSKNNVPIHFLKKTVGSQMLPQYSGSLTQSISSGNRRKKEG